MKVVLQDCTVHHRQASKHTHPALDRVSITVNSGEQVAIIGPSGSGKTTLLNVISCAMRPVGGSLWLGNKPPWELDRQELRRLRGTLFLAPQVPPLPPRQRVVTSVLAGRLPGMGLAQSLLNLFIPSDLVLAEKALARFDLAEKLFERVDRLSGGERQRVGLARLVASSADLLLVDEPLSALDPARARQAIRSISETCIERAGTLVVTLHHVEMALENFTRIVGMRGGELAFDLPAAQVTDAHLQELYASQQEELADADPAEALTGPRASAAMICR
jgi:phosphonate transport system ATP-binding protein